MSHGDGLWLLQAAVKQWDKSQHTQAHREARARTKDRRIVSLPPAVYALGQHLLLDVCGEVETGRIECHALEEDKVRCDRVQVDLNARTIDYLGAPNRRQALRPIGKLEAGTWLQCRYDWRYSVYRNDLYYWLYEEVVLNIAWAGEFDATVFIETEPAIVFDDFTLTDSYRREKG